MKNFPVPQIASALCALVVLFAGSMATVLAEAPKTISPPPPAFEIKDLKRATKARAIVDNAWKFDVPCIEATIRTTEEAPEKTIYVRAYFYNRNKEVVAKSDTPSEVGDTRDSSGYRIPDYLKPKETYKVYFAVPARASQGKDRWTRVLVVMGKGDKAVAKMIPSDDLTSFPFPEKAFLPPQEKGAGK